MESSIFVLILLLAGSVFGRGSPPPPHDLNDLMGMWSLTQAVQDSIANTNPADRKNLTPVLN